MAHGTNRRAVRLEHLYTLAALAAAGAFAALVPTLPNDFWWHLRAGQLIADSGLPTTNRFAWSLPLDTPFVYATWLAEWLFYQLYRWLGPDGPALARNGLWLAALALVALDARRRSGSWRLAGLAVALAFLMTINNLIIRTQNWGWVPFTIFTLVLSGYAAGVYRQRALLALPIAMALWVNLHGGFILGPVLIGVYAFGETLRRLVKQPRALAWAQIRWLWLALLGVIAATVLNPLGLGIFGYVRTLLTDPPSQGLIVEWQAPTNRSLAGMFFFLSILALFAALAFARRRPSVTDVLLICALAWLAFTGQRYVVWFGMAAMPILAQCLAAPRNPLAAEGPPRRPGPPVANAVLAGVLVLLVLILQPPFKALLPLPAAYRTLFAAVPGAPLTYSASTPVGAAAWLQQNPGSGRLFNEMGYGSYLIWADPTLPVYIDPRVELFPSAVWDEYIAINENRDAQTRLDRLGVTRVLLDIPLQPALAKALAADPARWRLAYTDARSQIFERR